jgi:hypothetical protein
MRIIDIDMDFFLDKIAHDQPYCDERLKEGWATPWDETDVRHFLEANCQLSTRALTRGRIIKEHKEAFLFWRGLINEKKLTVPFDVIHIDAHSDLGGGDAGWRYIFEKLLHSPIEERATIERFRYRSSLERLESGNFLLYAMAAHWIKSLTLVCHPNWSEDYYLLIMKDCKDESGIIQLKKVEGKINLDPQKMYRISGEFEVDEEIP